MDRRNSLRDCCSLCVSSGTPASFGRISIPLHCRTSAFGRDAKGLECDCCSLCISSGTPASFGRISIPFIAALAPLDEMPRDLNMASLPTQQAANDARKDGCARQYAISASVKLREMKVWFSVDTEEVNSASDSQLLQLPRKSRNAP
jgi:hypothetical protein